MEELVQLGNVHFDVRAWSVDFVEKGHLSFDYVDVVIKVFLVLREKSFFLSQNGVY